MEHSSRAFTNSLTRSIPHLQSSRTAERVLAVVLGCDPEAGGERRKFRVLPCTLAVASPKRHRGPCSALRRTSPELRGERTAANGLATMSRTVKKGSGRDSFHKLG